eukprot:TRINITY_DN28541_c0_g1_i1.p1 TRINITY_DN28541_c0_g1~~TRINITY_DN28541_c0_g1_i1.p1  ORF type:complete len:316 (+),score=78.38 TRINITY_DN28541_c0_g1_i1:55-1002(+)
MMHCGGLRWTDGSATDSSVPEVVGCPSLSGADSDEQGTDSSAPTPEALSTPRSERGGAAARFLHLCVAGWGLRRSTPERRRANAEALKVDDVHGAELCESLPAVESGNAPEAEVGLDTEPGPERLTGGAADADVRALASLLLAGAKPPSPVSRTSLRQQVTSGASDVALALVSPRRAVAARETLLTRHGRRPDPDDDDPVPLRLGGGTFMDPCRRLLAELRRHDRIQRERKDFEETLRRDWVRRGEQTRARLAEVYRLHFPEVTSPRSEPLWAEPGPVIRQHVAGVPEWERGVVGAAGACSPRPAVRETLSPPRK